MFASGGTALRVSVDGSPRRDPGLDAGTYPALAVAASRDHDGHLYLLVVNRMPQPSGAVRAIIRTPGLRHTAAATIRRVESSTFHDWNGPKHPHSVRYRTNQRHTGRGPYTTVFPAHSITLIRLTTTG
jgi:hypothetical protein